MKTNLRFTKGSAQIKVAIQPMYNKPAFIKDVEDLVPGDVHKEHERVTVHLGEYCQLHKLQANYTEYKLYSIMNLMKRNNVVIRDWATHTKLSYTKALKSKKQEARFDIMDMYINVYSSEYMFNKYKGLLMDAFGSIKLFRLSDGSVDYPTTMYNILDKQRHTSRFSELLANHKEVTKQLQSNFNYVVDFFIQARLEHDAIVEINGLQQALNAFKQEHSISEEEVLNYTPSGDYTPNQRPVRNYGTEFIYQKGSLQDMYTTYYKGNKYTTTSVEEYEALLTEYVTRHAYKMYEYTYEEKELFVESIRQRLINNESVSEEDLARYDAWATDLNTIYVGDDDYMDTVTHTKQELHAEEVRTYQIVEEDEKAYPSITPTIVVVEDSTLSGVESFNKRVASMRQRYLNK